MFGLENPAILGAIFNQFVTPERIEGIREIFTKAKEKGVEIRLIMREGGEGVPLLIQLEGRQEGTKGNFQQLEGFSLEIKPGVTLDSIFGFMHKIAN